MKIPRPGLPFSLLILAPALLLAMLGCEDDGPRIVEMAVQSLAAADSVAAGQPLDVHVGFYSDRGPEFDRVRWFATDDSTRTLQVFQRVRPYPYSAKTPPSELVVGSVRLEDPPSRPFRIVAGDLVLRVHGGVAPVGANRLTVDLQPDDGPALGLVLTLRRAGDPTPLTLSATDNQASTSIVGACEEPGSGFTIQNKEGELYTVYALGRWPDPCDGVQRLVARARSRVAPASAHQPDLTGGPASSARRVR